MFRDYMRRRLGFNTPDSTVPVENPISANPGGMRGSVDFQPRPMGGDAPGMMPFGGTQTGGMGEATIPTESPIYAPQPAQNFGNPYGHPIMTPTENPMGRRKFNPYSW